MSLDLWLKYLLSITVLILTPGTAVSLVAYSSKYPLKTGIAVIFGGNISSAFLLITASIGITQITSHPVMKYFQILGGGYLIYIAYENFRSYKKFHGIGNISQKHYSMKNAFSKAFLAGISNPKDILFFASFLSLFIPQSSNRLTHVAILTITWLFADLIIMFAYLYAFKKQKLIKHEWIITGSSILLLTLGVLLIFYGISSIFI